MRQRMWGSALSQVSWVVIALFPQAALAIEIRFDYRYDSTGMFAAPERRAVLDFAAQTFEVFTDQLTPISLASGAWTAQFSHPSENTIVNLDGESIAANEVVIFVGAYDLEGSALARGTVGAFYNVVGDGLVEALQTRGQPNASGSSPTDFGRWGGAISFDTFKTGETTPRVWHFDPTTPPPAGSMDVVSVALHEIAHVLGFSVSTNPAKPFSLETYLDQENSLFTGPNVQAGYGGAAPTDTSGQHWDASIMSELDGNSQVPIMTPKIYTGVRRGFTTLDYAAMADIGWEVPEELLVSRSAMVAGDYSGDAVVNTLDYLEWRGAFGSNELGADGNLNQSVDIGDYVVWRDAFDRSSQVVGDIDYSGVVDMQDYALWKANFGSMSGLAADVSRDGRVSAADYVVWRDAFAAPTRLAGDFNDSGTVDLLDYNLWKAEFGSATDLAADANGDGRVNAADYVKWRDNLNRAAGIAVAESSVPEPAGFAIAMVAVLLGAWCGLAKPVPAPAGTAVPPRGAAKHRSAGCRGGISRKFRCLLRRESRREASSG